MRTSVNDIEDILRAELADDNVGVDNSIKSSSPGVDFGLLFFFFINVPICFLFLFGVSDYLVRD